MFQKYGSPPYWSVTVGVCYNRGKLIAWRPLSPNFSPLELFLCGRVKVEVYEEIVESLNHAENYSEDEVDNKNGEISQNL